MITMHEKRIQASKVDTLPSSLSITEWKGSTFSAKTKYKFVIQRNTVYDQALEKCEPELYDSSHRDKMPKAMVMID